MNHNLPRPWQNPPRCSPPQTPLFVFYNQQNTDMLFDSGKEIVIFCQAGVRQSSGMTYSLHHNQVQTPFLEGKAEDLPGNLFRIRINTAKLRPGFYDIRVKYDCGFEELFLFSETKSVPPAGTCTFGWKIKEMKIADFRPADFRKFWDKAYSDYLKIPLKAKIESEVKVFTEKEIDQYNMESACLPGNFDPDGVTCKEVESYKISFAGPDGGRVYAWLAKPKGKGKFPAMLVLPGAGNCERPRPLDQARHGYVAIDIQVHGLDVDRKRYPKFTPGYANYKPVFEPVEKHTWYNIYLRAARGVDYLASLPFVDQSKIVTVGGSQGGRLSFAVPAIENRVAATVPCITNGPNYPHLAWVKRCNGIADPYTQDVTLPKSNGEKLKGAPPVPGTQQARCTAYFDPMNFAQDIKCPVFSNAGLCDPVSPAYSTWAAFSKLTVKDKTFVPIPGFGHDWYAAFDRMAYRWLAKKLNLKA